MRVTWVVLIACAFTLAGCGIFSGTGAFGTSGSAAQLHELAKIKDAACTKVTGVYMGATITVTAVNIDKGIPPGGGSAKIGADCATEITAQPPVSK